MAPREPLPERILSRIKNKRVIAYVIVAGVIVIGVANFSDSTMKLYGFAAAVLGSGAVPVVLPKDSGWMFAGYFDAERGIYTDGPYFTVSHSPYASRDQLPRLGEHIRVARKERNIIIADFETQGLTRRFVPPWQQNELKNSDYTGLKLPIGTIVEVRDVSLGAFPGRPAAVWVRVGSPK
jgi:hypothetical protein